MKEKTKIYEAWEEDGAITLSTRSGIKKLKKNGIVSKDAQLIHVIRAATYEEAKSIYNLRMGFEPYKPQGKPQRCPGQCGSFFYPDNGGECPYCES